jgi:tetratricopeptide (TPR) repeat protein
MRDPGTTAVLKPVTMSATVAVLALVLASAAPAPALARAVASQTAALAGSDADRAEAARLEAEAIALRDAGDFLAADRRVADLIPIELRMYGPDSDLLANSHGFRADLAFSRNDPAAAALHLRQELVIRQRRSDVGGAATSGLRLVEALVAAGQISDAAAELRRFWPTFTTTFSPNLPMAQRAVDGVVLGLARSGDQAGAGRLLDDLVAAAGNDDMGRERWFQDTGDRLIAADQSALGVAMLRRAVDSRAARNAPAEWRAEAWGRLADGQGMAFDWASAARSRRAALDLRERSGSSRNREREAAYLGRALLEAGENAEAYQRLSAARTAFQGRDYDDGDRAYVAVHLARAALATGREEEADRYSREARAMRTSGPAADPNGLRLALEVRADLMMRQNRLEEAETLLGQARELALAHDVTGTAVSVIDSRISDLRGLQGRTQDAEALARSSIEDVAARFGPRSPQMVVVLGNLATQLSNAGQFERAVPLVRQAADIQREVAAGRTEGPEVRELLGIEYKLGRVLGAAGRQDEGLALLSSVNRRAERALGRSDVVTIDSGVQAGYLMMQLGRLSEAEVQLRKMARLAEAARGAESYEMIDVLQLHSAALFGLGRYEECLVVMRRVLALSEAVAPRWPRTRIDVMTNTAMTLIELDRTSEAIALLRRAGELAMERNARAGAAGSGEAAMSRQPFVILVRAAWEGAHGA